MNNEIYKLHPKLEMINNDIRLYKKMGRYKDMLANMRHGIEYITTYIIVRKSPANAFDDLYTKIEALRQKNIISKNQANTFHSIRKLANSGGSHLEIEVGKETKTSFYPYMKEVETFLNEYGNISIGDSITNINETSINTNEEIEEFSPSYIFSTCANGISYAESELENKKIQIKGVIGQIFENRFNLVSSIDGKETFIIVEPLDKSTLKDLSIGQTFCVIGLWFAPSMASLRFGNAGTIKETK